MIVCLAAYVLIRLKAHLLLDDYPEEIAPVDSTERTFKVCRRAVMLGVAGKVVLLAACYGCAWPYLFIEGVNTGRYIIGVVVFGLLPLPGVAFSCYLDYKGSRGYIRISEEKIEYQRRKHFSIRISDVKKASYPGLSIYRIDLKEKGSKPLFIDLNAIYMKKEICSLMKEWRDRSARLTGRDKTLAHKLSCSKIEMFLGTFLLPLFNAGLLLLLVHASYCCIDYDYVEKDYTTLFNSLGADANQTENAWEHYVQAAVNYTKLEDELQESMDDCPDSGEFDFSDEQKAALGKWFEDNTSSWASLREAVSIKYCNATYEHISLHERTRRDDFSHPSDGGYDQIRLLYTNANTGRLAGVLDLGWFDLFQMQLASSRHFINGKTFMDQLAGYGMLRKSIKLLANQDNYESEELQKARRILKENFPAGLLSLRAEGVILMVCSSYDTIINFRKIPVQTPLNPVFHMFGSRSGVEAYVRKRYAVVLDQAKRGIEVEARVFSIRDFPFIMKRMLFGILEGSIGRVYEISQRAAANLAAGYVVVDLEECRLAEGRYPVDISELAAAGFDSPIPDDPDGEGEIIYRNDGKRAVLYAVGRNGIDEGGFRDEKGSDEKRDDIVFWERDLEGKARQ